MTEQQECYPCRGTGLQRDGIKTCNNCGGRGWKMEFVRESSSDNQSEPLFFNFLLATGIITGAVMGGYFGWSGAGIGGALAYGAGGAIILGICAALFSAFLRILIGIAIVIAIFIVICLLWGKGKKEETGSRNVSSSTQR